MWHCADVVPLTSWSKTFPTVKEKCTTSGASWAAVNEFWRLEHHSLFAKRKGEKERGKLRTMTLEYFNIPQMVPSTLLGPFRRRMKG